MSSKNLAICWKTLKPLLLTVAKWYNNVSNNAKDVTMGNQQATQVEIGWLAGIIDGEGYLGISVNKDLRATQLIQATPMMHICNTDEAIVLRANNILQKLGIIGYKRVQNSSYGTNRKAVYKVQIKHRKSMIRLIETIGGYLTGNKAKRAELMLEFCKSRDKTYMQGNHNGHPYSERELEIIELCLPLQRRGASETIRKAQIERSEIAKLQNQRKHKLNLKEQRACSNCGNIIVDRPSRFKPHANYFCCFECRVDFQRKQRQAYQTQIAMI